MANKLEFTAGRSGAATTLALLCAVLLSACSTLKPQTFAQSQSLLDQQLASIAPGQPGKREIYLLVVAGYDEPNVFSNEMNLAAQQLGEAFHAQARTLRLSNAPQDAAVLAQASPETIDYAIQALAHKMNAQEDVLAMYFVSHGADDGTLVLHRPGQKLAWLSPQWLRVTLNQADVKWRMAFVSACFSGGFAKTLSDEDTMVITAADAVHPSFGCGATSKYTYFGQAFLAENHFAHPDWAALYADTAKRIREREVQHIYAPSNPQYVMGPSLAAYLQQSAGQ